jgi:hypothetical protein
MWRGKARKERNSCAKTAFVVMDFQGGEVEDLALSLVGYLTIPPILRILGSGRALREGRGERGREREEVQKDHSEPLFSLFTLSSLSLSLAPFTLSGF